MRRACRAMLLLLALPACALESPLSLGGGPTLHFRGEYLGSAPLAGSFAAVPPPSVSAGEGEVVVRSHFPLGGGCARADARLRAVGSELTLRVFDVPATGCPDAVSVRDDFGYRAVVAGLEPGRYRLRVVHTRDGHTREVVDTEVRVH